MWAAIQPSPVSCGTCGGSASAGLPEMLISEHMVATGLRTTANEENFRERAGSKEVKKFGSLIRG